MRGGGSADVGYEWDTVVVSRRCEIGQPSRYRLTFPFPRPSSRFPLPASAVTQSTDPALLVIDVQKGIDNPRFGRRNNPEAENRIAELLAAWRRAGRPVVHVQHMSTEPLSLLRPGLPGNAIKDEALPIPGEPL